MRVTPRASRDAVEGVTETAGGLAVAVRVRAAAEKGEANRAAEAVIAAWLGVPKRSVELVSGAKSRLKTLFVAGETGELSRIIAMRLAG